ncbi:hypothetical protein ETAA8_65050 [Anatilimnocola aggregata]|uniref:Uncharacterized protein n=1 Tax=Anatilimnocola aggregata TaxID=2528021 RepID=A0A517YMA5_9BACT|nr:hypothetical protein [Anatilimnocola aggregata]QDU31350.1 hypothetical protein ETAA8_65050 [Anatilimnocola aggregata]
MTTLLDRPTANQHSTAAERLRTTMAAVRIAFTWLGVRKTLSPEQKSQAADTFGAEREYLSAGKKVIDTSHPAFKAVTSVRSRIISYWKGISLPYPEAGIRLIRQEDIASFTSQLEVCKVELEGAVAKLDECYGELRQAARERLGSLYNSGDYPATLQGWFDVAWDFPSVEPPEYLRQLSPQLYQQEASRIAARFDEAVQLAEQAFTEELSKLVSHLTERLSGADDGKPKVFRDSVIENLREFFDRFRHLNIRSDEQLDDLVVQAQRVLRGVEPQQLRDNQALRQQVASQLSGVQSVLDGLLVDRPRRNILRRGK